MEEGRKRQVSKERAEELKGRIEDFLEARKRIPKGMDMEEEFVKRKNKILKVLNATEENWNDYHWQLTHKISDINTLSEIIPLNETEKMRIKKVEKKYRWAVSPYYLSLADPHDNYDPIRLLSIPTHKELEDPCLDLDPMGEEYTNPAGCITRRYPDRLIINVTNECAMYCRHCQRRRNIGEEDVHRSREMILESIEYIRENEEIRDVLITGGDALCLSDEDLEWMIKQLKEISHIDYIRLGTRSLVTMPQRITDQLCSMLRKYHPIYINTHFNHPIEITKASKAACEKLADSGIVLGNQAVLLNGINNNKYIMRVLNHELLKCRVRPYYIFHAKHVQGTAHFNTSIEDGIEIMEYLRGYTSGMAIPTFIVNAPKGQGKTPIFPNYIVSRGPGYVQLRTWEGNMVKYEDHETKDIRKCLE
ncbi:glutamate 2,3-aminomutase [Lacrimispora saccharolytica]|uniref:Lysine 2,3-aminomutase YodO family protein n=1 Tax=Lacrimispora saccharolytica (strain ATCC 35040 / DSM 2544 / NRCC 2533 / WM1) TaxID=610130 RepID=D9R395_LACSW|nr:glutamate 2,3-aminomutase [Lacrimispora saccharolytica]ADL04844.1 lysine 2,3-aminomutase YodO family protein [[Clostridium] saccharolyticum WM1]QRV20946.1 glutamate 2,3-aminomutase [Lacrimispora saccharolytica]